MCPIAQYGDPAACCVNQNPSQETESSRPLGVLIHSISRDGGLVFTLYFDTNLLLYLSLRCLPNGCKCINRLPMSFPHPSLQGVHFTRHHNKLKKKNFFKTFNKSCLRDSIFRTSKMENPALLTFHSLPAAMASSPIKMSGLRPHCAPFGDTDLKVHFKPRFI